LTGLRLAAGTGITARSSPAIDAVGDADVAVDAKVVGDVRLAGVLFTASCVNMFQQNLLIFSA
jgi:hypothetical protein